MYQRKCYLSSNSAWRMAAAGIKRRNENISDKASASKGGTPGCGGLIWQ